MEKTLEWSEKQTKQVTKFRLSVLTFLVQTHKVSVPVYEASQHISDILNYGDNVGNRHFALTVTNVITTLMATRLMASVVAISVVEMLEAVTF